MPNFFRRLLGRQPPPPTILSDAIEHLQIGIYTTLLLRYRSQNVPDAEQLADCVLSYAILSPPLRSKDYQSTHLELIRQHAGELANVVTTYELSQPLSYLYAAIILHMAILTRNPFSPQAEQLTERAAELEIYIPNTYDICDSNDAHECIKAIAVFADTYLQGVLGKNPPPTT